MYMKKTGFCLFDILIGGLIAEGWYGVWVYLFPTNLTAVIALTSIGWLITIIIYRKRIAINQF